MKFQQGNIWDIWDTADLFLFTGNSTVTQEGRLVMGRGLAREVRDRFPNVDYALGQEILKQGHKTSRGLEYGLIVSPRWPEAKLGVLQVKYNWKDNADRVLINNSLIDIAMWSVENKGKQIHLNMPGIGNGGLPVGPTLDQVWGILKDFPSITVWYKANAEIDQWMKTNQDSTS